MLKLLLLFFILFTLSLCFGQEGAWNPQGADTSYPRTMLKAFEIEAVRTSLTESDILILYQNVANNAFAGTPTGNVNQNDRRNRAVMAKNAGFVLLMNRKISNNTPVTLTEQERNNLQSKTILLLEQINTDVDNLENFPNWQWRSKELIDYVIAYDMLKGAGVASNLLENSKLKIQEFAGNLYHKSTSESSLQISGQNVDVVFFDVIKNNHALMTASALGIAAVVLNDAVSSFEERQPQKWIDAAMWNIDNVLWKDEKRQSEPGEMAGYAESPYYFRYGFINCLPFIRSMGNFLPDNSFNYAYNNITRSIRNPFYDPNYDNLYEWIRIIRMPDGRLPALDHSFIDMAMPELALTGKSRYNWPLSLEKLAPNQNNTLNKQLTIVGDMRSNYIAAKTPPAFFDDGIYFHALPASGNIVFRSSWQPDATYMHIHVESGRALSETEGHNQADETSFIIQSHGQLLALDPGYLSWGRRAELRNAENHNMILVNGEGPDFGIPGSSNGAEVFIKDAFNHENLMSSKVSTSYRGADISRRALFIRKKYFLMMDSVSSISINNYQWQLHGYGLENGTDATGIFTGNATEQKGLYSKNGVNLLAQITAENGISNFEKKLSQHELIYNTTEDHTAMLIHKNGVQNTSFLSLLAPYVTNAPTSSIVSNTSAAAIKIQDQFYHDFAFSRTTTNPLIFTAAETGLKKDLETDASNLFFSEDNVGQLAQYFFTNGIRLQYDQKTLIEADRNVDFYLEMKDEGVFIARINEAATVTLGFDYKVEEVAGNNIESWGYSTQDKTLTIRFSGPGHSDVTYNIVPFPVELISFTAALKGTNVQLSWTTASEVNNDRFEIEKSSDGKSWEKIGEVKGNGTTTEPIDYSYLDIQVLKGNYNLYYRLKQVDYNGTFEYSDIKVVNISSDKKNKTFRIYPNPASDYITVSLDGNLINEGIFMIMNGNGQIIKQVSFKDKKNFTVDISHLPKGIYYCKIINETVITYTEKLFIHIF